MRTSFVFASALASSLLLLPSVAHAGDILSTGVGVLVGGGIVGLSKPGDTTVDVGGVKLRDETYPGFFGPSVGAGIAAEARIVGIVGLEIDALYQFSERGKGDLTLGSTKYSISIGQSAFHVPILAKVVLPLPVVRPFVGLGPELVFPGDASAKVTGPGAVPMTIGAKADSYVMLAAALGVEIKLPLPAIDLRIPIAFRFGLNPGTSDKVVDRRETATGISTNAVTAIAYKSEWQYQGQLTAGLSYWF